MLMGIWKALVLSLFTLFHSVIEEIKFFSLSNDNQREIAFFSLLLFRRTTFFVFNFLLSESIFQLVGNHGASFTEEPSVESVTITQNIQIILSSVK